MSNCACVKKKEITNLLLLLTLFIKNLICKTWSINIQMQTYLKRFVWYQNNDMSSKLLKVGEIDNMTILLLSGHNNDITTKAKKLDYCNVFGWVGLSQRWLCPVHQIGILLFLHRHVCSGACVRSCKLTLGHGRAQSIPEALKREGCRQIPQ